MRPINPSAVSIMAIYTFLWGLWVANPFWDVFVTAPLYMALNSVMCEAGWGIIAIICGFFMLWGVVRGSFKSLSRGAFAGAIHWAVISGGYFVGDWHNTGGITALMIAIYCSYIYLNLRVNQDNLRLEENHVKI